MDDEDSNETCDVPFIINDAEMYDYLVGPSIIIIMLLMFTQVRKTLYPHICGGKPALIIPMNPLEGRRDRLLYASGFILTVTIAINLVNKDNLPIAIHPGEKEYQSLNVLLSIGIYVLCCYPIFACLTLRTSFSYIVGTVYIWVYAALFSLTLTPTQCTLDEYGGEDLYVLEKIVPFLPVILSLLFLCIAFPYLCVTTTMKTGFTWFFPQPKPIARQHAYQRRHVELIFEEAKELRRRKLVLTEGLEVMDRVKVVKDKVYKVHEGFRYSPRIISSVGAALAGMYLLCYYFLYVWHWIFWLQQPIYEALLGPDVDEDTREGIIRFMQPVHDALSSREANLTWSDARSYLTNIRGHTDAVLYTSLVSIIAATLFSIFHMLHFMRCHRAHLHKIHTGKFKGLKTLTNATIVAESMKFSGYQAAYFFWGFAIQASLLFLVIMIVLEVVILPIVWGYPHLWLYNMLIFTGIPMLISIVISKAQYFISRFVLLQNPQDLALDNRRFYFILVFLFYFYNVVVGIFSCLVRILKQLVFGIWFISRLDYSTLSRIFEGLDPGFKSYVGFLLVENAHTNPAMVTFASLLLEVVEAKSERSSTQLSLSPSKVTVDTHDDTPVLTGYEKDTTKDSEKLSAQFSLEMTGKQRRLRNKWFVAYTLICNPALKFHRTTNKNYLEVKMQAEKLKAREMVSEMMSMSGVVSGALAMGSGNSELA